MATMAGEVKTVRLTLLTVLIISFTGIDSACLAQESKSWQPVTDLIENKLPDLGNRAVMMVWKDGKIQYSESFYREAGILANNRIAGSIREKAGIDGGPFDASSRQRIASSSKWLTAALVMTFVDEGKLDVEDSIGKFLPVMTKHNKGHIKILHCLSHLTGIAQQGIQDAIGNRARDIGAKNKEPKYSTMDEAIAGIAQQPMEGEAGKIFHYGNAGLQIAAAVLEKISGQSFSKLFTDRIARPLDMLHTDFGEGPVPLAAGGAWSTPNDYMHFLVMLLQDGAYNGKQILSSKAVESMRVNRIGDDVKIAYSPGEAGNWGYGFGEWVKTGVANAPSDFATSPGLFGSYPWINKEKNYAAMLFVVNIHHQGRHAFYHDLAQAVDNMF